MLTPTHMFWACAAFAFAFGAIIGSFLNVVIYRVPEGLSVVSPGSRCPSCHEAVRWYDNIPILSWFILRGRCRHCGATFSIRYALVEALTGFFAVAAWWQVARGLLAMDVIPEPDALVPVAAMFLLRFTFFAFLIAITFIDLDHFLIPHSIALPGIAVGLASPWIAQWIMGPEFAMRFMWPPVTPMSSLVGAILGYLIVVGLFYAYWAVRGAEGIGGGDATLLALLGAWLGWPALIFLLFAASVQGVLAAGVSMLVGGGIARKAAEIFAEDAPDPEASDSPPTDEQDDDSGAHGDRLAVPFGPFLALAGLEFALLGPYMPAELNMIYLYL